MDITENYKFSHVGDRHNYKDKMIEKSAFKNLNRAAKYLSSKVRSAFI